MLDMLQLPACYDIFGLCRNVYNENHLLTEFLRFSETPGGILVSRIGPKNDIMTLLAPHFADRLPEENWVIYDKTHEVFLIHEKGKRYYFLQQYMCMKGDPESAQNITGGFSEEEMDYEALWKEFVQSISVAERENRALQNQNLPLRFRTNLVEFSKEERSDSPNFGEFSS